jgi:hypothetical protein
MLVFDKVERWYTERGFVGVKKWVLGHDVGGKANAH